MRELKEIKSLLESHEMILLAFKDVLAIHFDKEIKPIEFQETLELPYPLTLNMGLNNEEFKSIVSLNFQQEFLTEFLSEYDIDQGMDAIGEVLNTICGSLAIREDIKEHFGELIQTPPMRFHFRVLFPSAYALRGFLQKENLKIYFGFLIQPSSSQHDKRY